MKNFIFLICMIFLAGCAKMNDKHDEFLAKGETVYIGKVDSVQAFPGNERLLLKYWISDPRVKNMTVYWGINDAKSKVLPVALHAPEEALEEIFTAADGLTEGNYTFHWISSDLNGNKSMTLESFARIYGNLYQEQLFNRRILETIPADNGDLDITLGGSSSSEEIGMEISYTQTDGTEKTDYYPQPGTSLTLLAVNYAKGVYYRTLYKPSPTAIDTFYTNSAKMDIVKTVNVALNKPTKTINAYWETGEFNCPGVVDGNIGPAAG
ncbi:MAG: DUF4998 domain-containing protein, partial [Tannerella sp.]|nr:DUF4998 domain-containing protein [Tannerella sp.]